MFKTATVTLVCGLTSMAIAGTSLAAQTAPVHFVEGPAHGMLQLTAEPAIGEWIVTDPVPPGDTIGSSGGYRLTLERAERAGHAIWTARLTRPDGAEFNVTACTWTASVPLGSVATVFDTQAHRMDTIFRRAPQLDAAIEVRPNQGVPYMMACDHYGQNSLAVGAMDQAGTYRITGRRLDENYTIAICRDEYPGDKWYRGRSFADSLFLSVHSDFWFDAARAFADAVDADAGYEPRPRPAKADLPYYGTWYAFGDKIDDATIREQGRLAAEMGCGNFLIFIGWGVCQDWFGSGNEWGDYTPCTSRFPDFADLVRYLQNDCKLAVEVWVAPTWIGGASKAFEKMKDFRSKWPDGDYDRNLDPRSPEARKHIRDSFAKLARDFGLDGFYVDFADTLYNRNDAPHEMNPRHFGSAYELFLKEVYEGFASQRPAPLVEYRIPFANLLSKRHASVFTTTYTEGDWNRGRLLAMTLRPFTRGVITRTDPLVWTASQLDHRDEVGKAISAMLMLGPPGISMDLTTLKDDQRARLGRWFKFFAEHRENLLEGEFRPFGEEFHCPEMLVHRNGTAYAWVSRWETGHIPLPAGTRRAFIFTALPEEVSFIARVDLTSVTGLVPGRYRARWFDSSLESHDGWFEIIVQPPKLAPAAPDGAPSPAPVGEPAPLRTPRENWDFPPDPAAGRPSLDIRRGGFLELEHLGN